jgi:hypothetical protein
MRAPLVVPHHVVELCEEWYLAVCCARSAVAVLMYHGMTCGCLSQDAVVCHIGGVEDMPLSFGMTCGWLSWDAVVWRGITLCGVVIVGVSVADADAVVGCLLVTS